MSPGVYVCFVLGQQIVNEMANKQDARLPGYDSDMLSTAAPIACHCLVGFFKVIITLVSPLDKD